MPISTSSGNLKVFKGDSQAMSKSKKNVVDPDDIIKIFGSDAVRWFILSDSPPDRDIQWSDSGIQGAYKYIQKIWRTCEKISNYHKINENFNKIFLIKIDILVKEISECVEKFQMNVAVDKFYTFLNLINDEIEKLKIDKNKLENDNGFVVNISHVALHGLCKKCANEGNVVTDHDH